MSMMVPLWSIPRSVSTGFERMMMERGDFKVIHEPFSYYFYQKAQGAKSPPWGNLYSSQVRHRTDDRLSSPVLRRAFAKRDRTRKAMVYPA